MNNRSLLLAGLLAGAPAAAFGFTRVGFGFNFGFPLYDYPPPTNVVVVRQPAASEVAPPSPGPDYVWITGHWEWDPAGRRWMWFGGSWQRPPAPNAVWQTGYWSQQAGTWVWVASHWAVPNPAAAVSAGPPPAPTAPPAPAPAAEAPPAVSAPPQEIVVGEAPPPPIVEEVYAAPAPDFIWIGGYWSWTGAWVWVPGHYARPPHAGAVWVAGGWHARGRSWVWAGGHWR